jgi:hypothetical protein
LCCCWATSARRSATACCIRIVTSCLNCSIGDAVDGPGCCVREISSTDKVSAWAQVTCLECNVFCCWYVALFALSVCSSSYLNGMVHKHLWSNLFSKSVPFTSQLRHSSNHTPITDSNSNKLHVISITNANIFTSLNL